ncbi:MAG: aminotransferase class V-fold PLP-dependent enzyme [Erysipelotrichaceae bacterium]|jgi:cystathionine beta-lyase family protein involved in aluminum resistance
MKTYPLESISLKKAKEKQFRIVQCIMNHFTGSELLTLGDLGVRQPDNQPLTTIKAEKAIAEIFNSEDCVLIRGSGTGAIRYGLTSMIKNNEKLLVHNAAIYSTTVSSIDMLGINVVRADFNDLKDIKKVIDENPDIVCALVQHTRQKLDDRYDIKEVIKAIKKVKDMPVICDDNYAVFKVDKISCESGADLSCFSTFKLQGPEGIGCVVGKKEYISKIRKMHYSGGCQTQGWEALEVLRGFIYAPVMLAIASETSDKILEILNAGEIKGIKNAYLANAQSKVLIIEFEKPIARQVLAEAEKMGALPYPVGAESKYEFAPMFYRVSGTFLKTDPTLADRMIRINPNRAGAETVLNVLKKSIEVVEGKI